MTTDFSNLSAEQKKAAGRALIKRHREIWPGAGWPDLETAIDLVSSAMTAVNAYGAGQADAAAWQDISSAPKDGSWIEVKDDEGNIAKCKWDPSGNSWGEDGQSLQSGFWLAENNGWFQPNEAVSWRHAARAHPPAASATIAELTEALQNMVGCFDNAVRRRKMPGAFEDEACSIARAALAGGRT